MFDADENCLTLTMKWRLGVYMAFSKLKYLTPTICKKLMPCHPGNGFYHWLKLVKWRIFIYKCTESNLDITLLTSDIKGNYSHMGLPNLTTLSWASFKSKRFLRCCFVEWAVYMLTLDSIRSFHGAGSDELLF